MRLAHLVIVPLLITASCGGSDTAERADSSSEAPPSPVADACDVVPDNFLTSALGADGRQGDAYSAPPSAEYACRFEPVTDTGRSLRVLSFSGTEVFGNLPDGESVGGIGDEAVSFSDDGGGSYFYAVGFVVGGNTYAVELYSDDYLMGAEANVVRVLAEQIANALD